MEKIINESNVERSMLKCIIKFVSRAYETSSVAAFRSNFVKILSQFITLFNTFTKRVLCKKLHNHEHTFVKSCCFLEALNVHSSKAETVELEVQFFSFFCDEHKFPHDSNNFWFALCLSLEYSLTFIYCFYKCLVL